MDIGRFLICTIVASFLALAGCATSPLDEQKRQEMEADIDDILSYELDPLEYGETRNCLSENDYRSYRALGQRHLLFEGRHGKLWVNVLRGRCPGLGDDSLFIMKPKHGTRLCENDWFNVTDRFRSLSSADTAPTCVLGEFKPVTEAQVKEIKARLAMR